MSEEPSARLDTYRSMRDFDATPEPSGDEAEAPADKPRFVVQEHHATALHWDFRLERDGVLPSWAVPMGIPPDPRENHLAVQTEDHPLSYLSFDGDIPQGSYGGGNVTVWDTGTYDCEKFEENEVIVTLHGKRVRGRYSLFRTRGRDWMIHRMDPPEDPTRELMPSGLLPMTASEGKMPRNQDAYAFEPAWSGLRVLAASKGGRIGATDASGADVRRFFPELSSFGRSLGAVEVILDGVLVVAGAPTDRHGGAERRLDRKSDSAIARAAERSPAVFMAFDVVWLEGHGTGELAYANRQRFLEKLAIAGPAWQTTPSHPGEGKALLAAARAQGLPGVVAKRLDSVYRHAERTEDWIVVSA